MSTDVLIPEAPCAGFEVAFMYQAIANGDEGEYQSAKAMLKNNPGAAFQLGVMGLIRARSRKPSPLSVPMLDVPLTPEWREATDAIKHLDAGIPHATTLDEILADLDYRTATSARLQDLRETVIAHNVDRYIRATTDNATAGGGKRLLQIGYLHSDLVGKLNELGHEVSVTANSSPSTSEYYADTAWRLHKRGEQPSGTLLMRAYLDKLINIEGEVGPRHIRSIDTPQRIAAARKIIDMIPDSDLEAMCQDAIDLAREKDVQGLIEAGDQVMVATVGQVVLRQAEVRSLLQSR